eukprot:GHVU01043076.1.p1 GENE.GHVU01043076.1~~GHVU01043076.1.p1  ORF type:complete len:112 (-),score=6.85 GHVU01043076.1:90-425(-)
MWATSQLVECISAALVRHVLRLACAESTMTLFMAVVGIIIKESHTKLLAQRCTLRPVGRSDCHRPQSPNSYLPTITDRMSNICIHELRKRIVYSGVNADIRITNQSQAHDL